MAPMVGRAAEIGQLRRLISRAGRGAGGAVLITGEPGIGKTRLIQAASSIAVEAALAVRYGSCDQLEVERTLGAPLRAFGGGIESLMGLSTVRTLLAAGAAAAAGSLLVDRLLEELELECARSPLVLAIEDLHWSDTTTLVWLRCVIRRARELPLLVVLTTRPPVPGTDLYRALSGLPLERLDLGPLPSEDSSALTAAVLGQEPTALARAAVDQAGGNPLLLLAILDALSIGADSAVDGISALVRELDRQALRTLQIAAVVGTEIDPVAVAAIAGIRTTNLLVDLEAAAAAGVVVPRGAGFTFRHELLREAVLAELSPQARAALHRDAAQVLATSGAGVLAVAEQYARGAGPGDYEAATWLRYAAQEIVGTAPAAALRLCDIAIAACDRGRPPAELVVARVRALAGAGRAAEAEALGRTLLQVGLAPAVEARLRRELAFAAFMQGRADVAAIEMERCGVLTDDPALRARVQGEIAFARFLQIDHPGAREAGERAIADGLDANDGAAQVAGGGVLCFLDLFQMRLDEAGGRAREIVQLADRPETVDAHVFQPWFIASVVWLEADRFDLLADCARRGRENAVRYGSAWAVPAYDAITAFGWLRVGEIDDAAATAEAALSYADGVDGFGVAVWCNSFLAQIALHRGADDVAAERIAAAEQWLARGRAQLGFEQLCLAAAGLSEHRGDLDLAYSVLSEVWDLFVGTGVRSALPSFAGQLARLASRTGHADRGVEVAAVLTELAPIADTPRVRVVAEIAAAWRDGDADRALRAAKLAAGTPLKPLAAATHTDAAALLRLRGRAAEADLVAASAASRWSAMGADADAANSAAMSRTARPLTPRAHFGITSLTGTERRVVGLVASGKANSDIAALLGISRRTVESHVSAAYRKLGVNSRVAMARIALRHGIGA
ncbi:ATP-binding protein [Nakamurella multipartita]|uniref:Transcriptional regulator, LuxR family n=1 Tax=Nakamurella multipartita (strain ATCC 700099 / DSM 44233 / CIP 104796 / JCM 9543 / NBRC 105858 / Y-104) TaxID=479431 RepID=C8X9R3_NAKMY|nr:LuxR family transcriptional regulator [Nakamurella multipartita]ACV79221.1 transcriptional regulator, LuxR family [Nakamurella multipartita DSM 44233]